MMHLSQKRNRRRFIGVSLVAGMAVVFAGLFAGTGGFAFARPISVTSSQGTCSFTKDFSAIQCILGDIKSGGSAKVQLVVVPTNDGYLTDTATVRGNEPDPVQGNNTDSVTTRVHAPPEAVANISLSKTVVPELVVLGRPFTYTLIVKNLGPNKATGVVLTDVPPLQINLVRVKASQGECDLNNGQVVCQLGSVPSGGQATVAITAVGNVPGMVFNQACVAAKEFDPDYSSNCDSVSIEVRYAATDLRVDKDGPANGKVNEPITYTIIVTNAGPDDATGVELSDDFGRPQHTP